MRARTDGLLLSIVVTIGVLAVAAPSASAHSNGALFDPNARAARIESATQEASVIGCATADSIERAHVYLTVRRPPPFRLSEHVREAHEGGRPFRVWSPLEDRIPPVAYFSGSSGASVSEALTRACSISM